jgi:glycosyltransferase involved in cell wall biosynthesis
VQRAIESALAQTHGGVEVIVVDDGSSDGTVSDLNARYSGDDRVVIIATENRGPSAARNTGLDAATGTHAAFLDSDDVWHEWKLEFQLRCLDLVPDAGMIWSDMAAVDPDGAPIAERYLRTLYRHYGDIELADFMERQTLSDPRTGEVSLWHGDPYPAMLFGNLVHTSTVLLTRERLETVGRFDESLTVTGEDFDFHLRTCRAGVVALADTPTMTWRVGALDQLTRRDLMTQMARNYLTTIDKAVAADDGRLSEAESRRAVAKAHAWLGEELLIAGPAAEASTHLRTALRGQRRIRTAILFALSKLPEPIGAKIRRVLASLSRPFRHGSAG